MASSRSGFVRLHQPKSEIAVVFVPLGYVKHFLSSRLSVSNALGIWFSRTYGRFFIYSGISLVGLARGTVEYGVQLPSVLLLGASAGRAGRLFIQLLFHDPISACLRLTTL